MATVRKVNRRKSMRTHYEKTAAQIKNCSVNPECTETCLIGLKASLTEQAEQLSNLEEEIVNLLDPDEVEEDVLTSIKFAEPIHELVANITLRLSAIKTSDSEINSVRIAGSATVRCKLPKLELPMFNGNPIEWQGFWDQFNVSIHLKDSISDIDRFNYLKDVSF